MEASCSDAAETNDHVDSAPAGAGAGADAAGVGVDVAIGVAVAVAPPSTASTQATQTAATTTTTPTTTATTGTSMPPKPRKTSGASSQRRVRTTSGQNIANSNASTTTSNNSNSSGAASPGATSGGGIVVGLRRRHRVSSGGGSTTTNSSSLYRQGSTGSSDEDTESTSEQHTTSSTTKKPTPRGKSAKMQPSAARSGSLKNVASLIRSNIRHSIHGAATEAATGGVETFNCTTGETTTSSSFAGVAHQVVSTQRAARGFLAMWHTSSSGAVHVYKGVHMEKKKLELKTVVSEFKELKRRQFYQELVVYLLFLFLFFSLLAWLPVQDSYQQNDVVGALTCREEGVCELKKVHDVYEFASTISSQICGRPEEGKGQGDDTPGGVGEGKGQQQQQQQAQWLRIGGVRFRQVRVQQEQCKIFNNWSAPCYPYYSEESESKTPIHSTSSATGTRIYKWNDQLGPLQPRLSNSIFEWYASSQSSLQSFGSGGYTVDLCQVDVDELQQDEWLSVATRAFSIEFMLFNPVTRVFTIGWHVFTNSPSGHMKHYPHSANLRVVGLEENELVVLPHQETKATNQTKQEQEKQTQTPVAGSTGYHAVLSQALATAKQVVETSWLYVTSFDRRIALWLALVLFFTTYCVGEANEMATMGVRTYLQSDMWNVFELTHLLVLAAFLRFTVRFYMASRGFVGHLGGIMDGKLPHEIDHSDVQELLRSYQQLSDLASIGSAVSLLKVFKFLRMNSTLNLLWRVLGMATRDLMGFLVIFNLIFLGYSAMGSYAFGFALEEFSTIGKSYATCFHMLAGEMDYPRLRQANPRIAPVFIVTFIVLVFQILVNMFVAILSEYYESAKNDEGSGEDLEYDVLARVRKYIKACSPTVVVKKNEVLRLSPRQQVRLISTNLVDQEETRQRARKLFRGAVWRVVALLRFGVKFDRRIQFGDRKNNHLNGASNPTTKDKERMASHIRLSENFDHKRIKEMIPTGITIRLQGDSLLGDGLALKVLQHNKLSVECVVLGLIDSAGNISTTVDGAASDSEGEQPPSHNFPFNNSHPNSRERVLELLGGEKLRIPWQIFVLHLCKTFLKELQESVLRATKLWNYSKTHLVNDYHLLLLFESMRAEGRTSLRYDEVYRMLDLYLRRDKKKSLCTQAEVRQEALQVMFRFRKCLIDMPSREKEGHNYRPKPVDTSAIDLGQLEHLADMLAQNCHDMWAMERLKQGWHYGAERDDAKKFHPNLVPYDLLSWEEQQYDHRSSMETLKTILFMNYSIVRANNATSGSFHESLSRSSSNISDDEQQQQQQESGGGVPPPVVAVSLAGDSSDAAAKKPPPTASQSQSQSQSQQQQPIKPVPLLKREAASFRRNSLMEDSPYSTLYGDRKDLKYHPLPIDTTKIGLPPRLIRLVDLLAENAHEVWAKGRMDEGWTYGPQRNDLNKKHPCLVPYIFLTDDEKEYDLNIAKETLKTLLAMKFTLVDRSSNTRFT